MPHDPEGLAELMGGKEGLGIWLDSLFTTSSELVGEHVSGDITGLIGQYAHGNEPSHHVPFLYRYSDRPWRAEEVIDTIMYHFYQPEPAGIIGNEGLWADVRLVRAQRDWHLPAGAGQS